MAKSLWTKEDIASLVSCGNARDFFASALAVRKSKGLPSSYAELARSAGFASRSFPRDVLLGKKKLSRLSASKLSRALKLSVDLRDMFLSLVELDSHDIAGSKSVESIRRRIERKSLQGTGEVSRESAFDFEHFALLYASLGKPGVGATLVEILRRSMLPVKEVEAVISGLEEMGLVHRSGDRFVAKTNHLAWAKLKADGAFQRQFIRRVSMIGKQAKQDFESPTCLFHESTFSVRADRLEAMKEELREVLLRFTDRAEDPEGARIVSVTAAMVPLMPSN